LKIQENKETVLKFMIKKSISGIKVKYKKRKIIYMRFPIKRYN